MSYILRYLRVVRADRLLSILLLLQAHGRMTAGTLARRLEVSQRTIYRDLDALGAAGVPVVIDQGPHGGASLLPGWRTDVTGLTETELSALLAFAASAPAADLGLSEDLERAARKLAVAAGSVPAGNRFRDRVLVDINPWVARRVPAHLGSIQDAVWSDRCLALRYRRGDGVVVERTVEPYGLVAKNGVWYLLARGESGIRTYRVSRVEDAAITDTAFVRPPGFDLERAWADHSLPDLPAPDRVAVKVRADPVQAALFYRLAASRVIERAEDGDSAILEFPAADAAAGFIASFGALVEVLDPPQVRARLGVIGRELSGLYR
jgi:predicted DNA-binding transcriptional regulator YafY